MAQIGEFTENFGLLHSKKKLIMKCSSIENHHIYDQLSDPEKSIRTFQNCCSFIPKEDSELDQASLPTHVALSTRVAFLKRGLLFSLSCRSMTIKLFRPPQSQLDIPGKQLNFILKENSGTLFTSSYPLTSLCLPVWPLEARASIFFLLTP